ncbi:hypothetical protein QMP26_41765 (plasmid) [Enterocloster clostridioformis]
MLDIFDWIKENGDSWDILCGKKAEMNDVELKKLYDDLMKLAGENGQYHILISTFLEKYGKRLFPDMSNERRIRIMNRLSQGNMTE